MKQFVLMNKKTGEQAAGIRLMFFDNPTTQVIETVPGYSVSLASVCDEPDLWAVQADENELWYVIPSDILMKKVEVVDEL